LRCFDGNSGIPKWLRRVDILKDRDKDGYFWFTALSNITSQGSNAIKAGLEEDRLKFLKGKMKIDGNHRANGKRMCWLIISSGR
jgi:hypothetical protein